ncbi:MAG: hypothetical protein FWD16_06145, partial [Clostridia bacterium]|nr:hypothetical protein [Clostridia bacterium]
MYKTLGNRVRGQIAALIVAALVVSALLPLGIIIIGASDPDKPTPCEEWLALDQGPEDPPGAVFDIFKLQFVDDLLLEAPNGVKATLGGKNCAYTVPVDQELTDAKFATFLTLGGNWHICDDQRGSELRGFMPGMQLGRDGRFLKAIQYVFISAPSK